MKVFHLISASTVVVALVACAPKQQGGYDTANPYGASAANAPYQPDAPANPTYDTPAAYEDSTAAVTPTTEPAGVTPTAPPVANQAAATTHTVVKGDTLGGIATKHKVPMASIMKANNMTKDTVVLGKKLIIPAH